LKIVQRLSHNRFDLSIDDVTIFYLNPSEQRLIIGNKKLLSLSHVNQSYAYHRQTSHSYPLTQLLYNSLFDMIISSDESSTIHVWSIQTGEKTMHILNAHTTEWNEYSEQTVEITAMCFDEARRRLITGAHDGSLALWNFNNGHNLYRVHANNIDPKEITALLHENERLFVGGWSRRVRVFHLAKSAVIRQSKLLRIVKSTIEFNIQCICSILVDEFRSVHNDDILSMSIMMNILATGNTQINILFVEIVDIY
jgi:WD40 repeat protein